MQQKYFGLIQKVCSLKTLNVWPAPPCSSLFILYAGCLWIFEWKIEEWKERKELFFGKLNIKDGNGFYTDGVDGVDFLHRGRVDEVVAN